jgi:predicted negative regulator of RcsB-dependent stress response
MAIQLADVWYGTERSQDAINIYAGLAVQDDGPWAALAKLRLAEIALADRRPEDGLLWCNKLLNRAPLLPERDVLKLMGDAYLQTGQLRLAAQCYAGKRPDTQTMSP